MFGSVSGNIIGTIYFLIYQAAGIFIAFRLLGDKEKDILKLIIGSVFGSFLLHWCPTIASLVFGFNILSHIVALVLLFLAIYMVIMFTPKAKIGLNNVSLKDDRLFIGLFSVTFIYFLIVLSTHTIPVRDGAMYAGQCTYGDMNMHLGFITSIAVQGKFPPDYSILPGTKLCYPFLSDSISSSVYLFGASLRWAYMLPMIFAIAQVFLGFYCFAKTWLKDKSKAVLAWVLFFFNGGLGFFLYFIDFNDSSKFTRIFTEFYKTPTNLNENNIRWSNTIVDMLLPQRATLFGWAMLFTCMLLLYKAVFNGERKLFIPAAAIIGGLPMIHTHSFMVMGIVCAGWMLYSLINPIVVEEKQVQTIKKGKKGKKQQVAVITNKEDEKNSIIAKIAVGGGLVLMCILELIWKDKKPDKLFFGMAIAVVIAFLIFGILLLIRNMAGKDNRAKEIFSTWGVLLGIVFILALPQLVTWTFNQVSDGSFLKGQFNWVNETDNYIWFYLKNIGLAAIFGFFAMFFAKKKDFGTVLPALLIWFIAEMMVFQPNFYDNNKLLYGAYALMCCITAGYMIDLYRKMKKVGGRQIIAVIVIFVCIVSGALTMGREYVSEYELYGASQVKLCEYIEKNLEPDAMILTDQRHNNAVSSLTGRNIVCGAGTFLFFHGVNYQSRADEVSRMYADVNGNLNLYQKYNVGYVLVSAYERSSFGQLDEATMNSRFKLIYAADDVRLYKVQ